MNIDSMSQPKWPAGETSAGIPSAIQSRCNPSHSESETGNRSGGSKFRAAVIRWREVMVSGFGIHTPRKPERQRVFEQPVAATRYQGGAAGGGR